MNTVTMYDKDGNPVPVVDKAYARSQGYYDAPPPQKPEGWYAQTSRYGPPDFPPGRDCGGFDPETGEPFLTP